MGEVSRRRDHVSCCVNCQPVITTSPNILHSQLEDVSGICNRTTRRTERASMKLDLKGDCNLVVMRYFKMTEFKKSLGSEDHRTLFPLRSISYRESQFVGYRTWSLIMFRKMMLIGLCSLFSGWSPMAASRCEAITPGESPQDRGGRRGWLGLPHG